MLNNNENNIIARLAVDINRYIFESTDLLNINFIKSGIGIVILRGTSLKKSCIDIVKKCLMGINNSGLFKIFYERDINVIAIIVKNIEVAYLHYYSIYINEHLRKSKFKNVKLIFYNIKKIECFSSIFQDMYHVLLEDCEKEIIKYLGMKKELKKRILLIDQDTDNGFLLKSSLESEDTTVEFVEDINLNLIEKKICRFKPNIIIIEAYIPTIKEGLDTIMDVCRLNNNRYKILVLISGREDEDIKKIMKLGVHGMVQKPYSLRNFKQRVNLI